MGVILWQGHSLIKQGVVTPVSDLDLGPNGSFFSVPKNREKASFTVNLVAFNDSMRTRPQPLQIPSVQPVAILMIVRNTGNLQFLPPKMKGVSDPHVAVMWEIFSVCSPGGGGVNLWWPVMSI